MALVKRDRLCDGICRLAGITRRIPGKIGLSKRELLLLHSYLNLITDLTRRYPLKEESAAGGVKHGKP